MSRASWTNFEIQEINAQEAPITLGTGTPIPCEHKGTLADCEYDLNELLLAIAEGDGFTVSGFCATCGELVERTYHSPRTFAEESGVQGLEKVATTPEDAHAVAMWENEGGK